ncbi:hypothetical protein DC043_15325, partial [Enterococcus faecalis]
RVLHAHVGVAGDVGPAAHEAQHVLQREGVVGAVLPVDLEDAPRRGPLGVAGRLAVAAAQVPPGEDELQALDQGAAHGRRRCRRRGPGGRGRAARLRRRRRRGDGGGLPGGRAGCGGSGGGGGAGGAPGAGRRTL